jgi:hypothetical protein
MHIGSAQMEQLSTVAFRPAAGNIVLIAVDTGNFPKTFRIAYRGTSITTTLHSESAATYA